MPPTGSPQPSQVVLEAIADFAANIGQWLKVAGGTKGECVHDRICCRWFASAELSTELGAFVRYSTARIACLLDTRASQHQGVRHASIEMDPVHVCVVRHHVNLARPAGAIRIVAGRVIDVLPFMSEEFG